MSKTIIFAAVLSLMTLWVLAQAKVMPAKVMPAIPAHGCITCHAVVAPCNFNRKTEKSCTDCHTPIINPDPVKKVIIDKKPTE